MYLVFFMYALLASTFSIGKLLVHMLPPIFLIAVRMIIAGTILSTTWYLWVREKNDTIKTRDLWLFGIVVLFHILLPFTSEYIALQYISPSSACLMYNLSPFLSALFSYFIFNELMTGKKWVGFGIGLIGIFFYLQSQCGVDLALSWSNGLMLISVITSSLGWIFVRLLVKNKGYSTLLINGFAMFVGGWIALPISKYCGEVVSYNVIHIPHIIGLLTLMILIANILFYNLYGYLLTKYTATFLSFAGFVTPLFAAFFEWMFFGVVVPHEFFLTVCIIGAGIFIFYQEELKQGYIAR
ncbi:DMT family transporter [Candidatus Babeliales bacterium]|nr:DMT family transporter [Candidatus Babeliales bacterium]MBP9843946.1 DMT family transporter [Candidatus Babeliales bacterium]